MSAPSNSCRLCGSATTLRFKRTILQKYEISYFECTGCESMQTEEPFWYHEANDHTDTDMDIGKAQRNVVDSILVAELLQRFGVKPEDVCLDFAGGEGLFCRFLRDRGFQYFMSDRFMRSA